MLSPSPYDPSGGLGVEKVRGAYEPRCAFVLLDDDLSYLLMWSPLIHSYHPLRPDVL